MTNPFPVVVAVLVTAFSSGACMTSEASSRHHKVGPPSADRCQLQAVASVRQRCASERGAGVSWVRKLMVDDQLCLLGNPMPEGLTSSCRVRAFVEETAPNAVKLEIREADPATSYQPMSDWWFHEDALVDVYLRSVGFVLPSDQPNAF